MSGETSVITAAQDLVGQLTLANIYTLDFEGERLDQASADSFKVEIDPRYLVSSDRVDFLFKAECRMRSDSELDVGRVVASVVVTFDADKNYDLTKHDTDAVEWIGLNVALYAAYPYLRETVQSLCSRIGLTNITMDLLKRGEPLPDGLSIGNSSKNAAK